MKLPMLTIATKLRVSLIAVVLGLAVVGFAYWRVSAGTTAADTELQRFQERNATVQRLAQAFNEARRLQAEYALSFSVDSGKRFNAARATLRRDLAQAALGKPSGTGPAATFQATVKDYLASAESLDERIAELGHDADSGLQGELREAVHGVENVLGQYDAPALQVSMLTMRRHEKDFILRRDQKYADQLGAEAMPFELLLQKSRIPEAAREQIRTLMQQYQDRFIAYAAARYGVDSEVQSLDAAAAKVVPALAALNRQQDALLQQGRKTQADERAWMNAMFSITLVAVAVVLVVMLVLLLRAIVRPLEQAVAFARDIADDRLDSRLAIHNPNDELGTLGAALQHMQASLRQRIEGERATARENARVRQALDAVQASVMVTDAQGMVVYVNDALTDDVARAGLGGETLLGTRAGELGTQVAAMLTAACERAEPQAGETELGMSHFRLQVSPVLDNGQLLGLAMEWQDRRLERVIEHEVAALVADAARGHLEERIGLDGKAGFVRVLAEKINLLLDSVETRLLEVTRVMEAFARGDLRERMRGDHQGLYASLRQGLDAAIEQVGGIVTGIQGSAGEVRASAEEMASGTSDLSARTERQASDLGAAMQLMDQVSGEVEQNIARVRDTVAMAVEASEAARQGREIAHAAVAGMDHIRGSSRRIAEIVATVDGLAFQTNLLALNAAVEAARAGSHGRGFAVVAGEVRNLAQRSSASAQEIRKLVDGSLQQVEQGAKLVGSTGATMDDILSRVERVVGVVEQINAASQRQGEAVGGVDRLLRGIGQGTEQNAALAEESNAAARSLLEQAGHLSEAAQAFIVQPEPVKAKLRAVG